MPHFKTKVFLSLLPVIFLIGLLAIIIQVYGSDSLSGGSQIVLMLATAVCAIISITYFHIPWKDLQEEINRSIGNIGTAIVILLLIGMLSGAWTVSGVVPTLI